MRVLNMISNIKNWPEYLYFKHFDKKRKKFLFKCHNGIKADVPRRMLHTFKESFFDDGYFRFLPKSIFTNNLTILDIGANVGYFSLFCLSKFKNTNIYSFEPMPNNFKLLKKNREDNSHVQFEIINKAVSDKKETIELQYDSNDDFTTAASIYPNPHGQDTIQVEAITLEDIVDQFSLSKIDILKMDCEGSEYKILYNLPDKLWGQITSLTMETHKGFHENETKSHLVALLKKKDFEVKEDNSDLLWAWKSS